MRMCTYVSFIIQYFNSPVQSAEEKKIHLKGMINQINNLRLLNIDYEIIITNDSKTDIDTSSNGLSESLS